MPLNMPMFQPRMDGPVMARPASPAGSDWGSESQLVPGLVNVNKKRWVPGFYSDLMGFIVI